MCRSQSSRQYLQLPSGLQWLEHQAGTWQGRGLPQLPEGQTCRLDDKGLELSQMSTASQQQLKAAQVFALVVHQYPQVTLEDLPPRLCLLLMCSLCGGALQGAVEKYKRRTAAAEAMAREAQERQRKAEAAAKESAHATAAALQDARAAQVHCSSETALCCTMLLAITSYKGLYPPARPQSLAGHHMWSWS